MDVCGRAMGRDEHDERWSGVGGSTTGGFYRVTHCCCMLRGRCQGMEGVVVRDGMDGSGVRRVVVLYLCPDMLVYSVSMCHGMEMKDHEV